MTYPYPTQKEIIIREIEPPAGMLVQAALPDADYCDAHEARTTPRRFDSITAFSRAFFLAQPAWLRTISMGVPSRSKMEQILATTKFAPGEKIGSWEIFDRDENEIVFGESLGFMSYRYSMCLKHESDADLVTAATVVRLNSGFGKAYFSIALLLHKRFLRLILKNALRS